MSNGNVPHAKRVKFKTLVANDSGPARALEEVIDTREEYDDWITSCVADRDAFPADFDFETQMLVAVGAGQRPTGGWKLQIIGIAEIVGGFVGVQWQVLYRLQRADGPVTNALTHPQHVVRTHRFEGLITFRRVEEHAMPTTQAVGEHGPTLTTLAVGEEGPQPTTLAVGEEGPQPTTLAIGEEGPQPTTLAIGEEDPQPTTLAIGEEGPQPTTRMIGEEGPQPTTLAIGEEGPGGGPTTLAIGEEVVTTLAMGEEGPGYGGGGSPFGSY